MRLKEKEIIDTLLLAAGYLSGLIFRGIQQNE